MKYLGTFSDYNFYISKEKSREEDSLVKLIDFVGANGITDFDSRSVLVLDTIDVREKLTVLGHEIMHVYMERWGLHNLYSEKQREFMAQFFGSVMMDVVVHNREEFDGICNKIREFKLEEPKIGGLEHDGASRIEEVSEG